MAFPPGANGLAVLLIAGTVVAASALSVEPRFRDRVIGVAGPESSASTGVPSVVDPESPQATTGPRSRQTGPVATTGPGPSNTRGLECAAGRNGGATDVGVTATEIKLASTVAESGNAASFLGDARFGMVAVVNRVNRAGGICGRRLSLDLVDDGFSSSTGQSVIRNFIAQGKFALAVVPSSQGLDAAVAAGDIDRAGIPVVGTDGLLFSQYVNPWVWPVATSTIAGAHIAAKNAYDAGSRTFGIVYDSQYKFGVEGEKAFRGAIGRLPGAKLKANVGIPFGQQDYSSAVQQFEQACQPCDMTYMLLEPDTALSWIGSDVSRDHLVFGSKRTAGPQPLFTSSFAQGCGALCNNMWVWSGFQAPYPPFDRQPAVRGYVDAIRSVSASADTSNQFLEGSYTGMELLVEALKKVGPELTRARLKGVLDAMTFEPGLTTPLRWTAGNHFANTAMLGFTIQYSGGFNGFQYQQTGWLKDPDYQRDRPAGR